MVRWLINTEGRAALLVQHNPNLDEEIFRRTKQNAYNWLGFSTIRGHFCDAPAANWPELPSLSGIEQAAQLHDGLFKGLLAFGAATRQENRERALALSLLLAAAVHGGSTDKDFTDWPEVLPLLHAARRLYQAASRPAFAGSPPEDAWRRALASGTDGGVAVPPAPRVVRPEATASSSSAACGPSSDSNALAEAEEAAESLRRELQVEAAALAGAIRAEQACRTELAVERLRAEVAGQEAARSEEAAEVARARLAKKEAESERVLAMRQRRFHDAEEKREELEAEAFARLRIEEEAVGSVREEFQETMSRFRHEEEETIRAHLLQCEADMQTAHQQVLYGHGELRREEAVVAALRLELQAEASAALALRASAASEAQAEARFTQEAEAAQHVQAELKRVKAEFSAFRITAGKVEQKLREQLREENQALETRVYLLEAEIAAEREAPLEEAATASSASAQGPAAAAAAPAAPRPPPPVLIRPTCAPTPAAAPAPRLPSPCAAPGGPQVEVKAEEEAAEAEGLPEAEEEPGQDEAMPEPAAELAAGGQVPAAAAPPSQQQPVRRQVVLPTRAPAAAPGTARWAA